MSRTAASRPGRVGRPWRDASARVYREEHYCWLCGDWVNPALPPRHRLARTADHLHQLCHGGDPTDRRNLRLAHMACNSARSNALRRLPVEDCACQLGLPCAAVNPAARRGRIAVDPATV